MPFNGSGEFVRVYDWSQDLANNIPITASRFDTEDNGFATGLSTCITKDGQTTITANIPFNSKKITGLAAGNARTDSLNISQVQDNQFLDLGSLGGSADAYTGGPLPPLTAYAASMRYTGVIPATNTTTTPYLQLGSIADPTTNAVIKKIDTNGSEIPLEAGDMAEGGLYDFKRNVANNSWILLNPIYQPNPITDSLVGMIAPFAFPLTPNGWLKCDGSAVSRSTYLRLFTKLITDSGFVSTIFTVTIASPAVFTKASHGFTGGERIQLSTTGSLPSGLSINTNYFVIYIDANTFSVSVSFGGSAINTSGSQSGTHSYLQSYFGLGDGSTTFNLPDFRGYFPRGWADAGSIDSGRAFGTPQLDAFQGHRHNPLSGTFVVNGGGTAYTGVGAAKDVATTGDPVTDGTNGTPRTASETRPINLAIMFCIKY